jgi:hypothetical protein
MTIEAKTFSTGIFRLVSGSVHEAQTKDSKGNPLTIKSGPNAGQPTQRYSFGIAVPKVPGKHWSESGIDWLTLIWQTGHEQMGALAQRKDFSWKVQDGDSTEVNKANRRNCDNEGWPGHWVVFFSSSFAPKCFTADAQAETDPKNIKRGHYVRVAGSVIGNGDTGNPGVYVNHSMVLHSGIGPEITFGPDAKTAFAAPAAAPAGMAPVPQTPAQAAFAPPPAATPAPPPAAPLPARTPPPAPVAVQPSPSFIAPPPAAVAPPPAAPARVWKEAGTTYEQYIAAGWNDDQLRAAGKLA